jgi:hypothetical protein
MEAANLFESVLCMKTGVLKTGSSVVALLVILVHLRAMRADAICPYNAVAENHVASSGIRVRCG